MSHDIRTPLSGVYGLSQVLHDHYDEEKLDHQAVKEMLGNIADSAKILLEFVGHVLQVSNLGKDPVKKEDIHIKDLIDEVMLMVLPEIKRKQLNHEINCPDICIKTDKFRALRILLNLISNAIKFTHAGSIKINIYSAKDFIIEIEDTGIGIPEDKCEQIFDPFYKVKPSNQSAEFNGCGLGLHLVRSMADEIGGKITVESKLNEGSKFTFTLEQEG